MVLTYTQGFLQEDNSNCQWNTEDGPPQGAAQCGGEKKGINMSRAIR